MGNIPRSYAASRFFLTLDGVECGFLQSAEGGDAVGEVVTVPGGAGAFADKRIGAVRYEDLALQVGMSMTTDLYDWINASWQLEPKPKNGTVAAADVNGSVQQERTFQGALVSDVGLPALDGASKEAAFLTVKLRPEQVADAKAGGRLQTRGAAKQKQWVASNFRLEIDGLDCKRVAKIDAFTVRQSTPDTVEFPNLTIALSAASAESWQDWHDDFLVKGNNGPDQERSGSITFLAPDLTTELARVELAGLGLVALRRPAAGAAADQIARVVAELYCERMSLKVAG
jgi:phage tail-like protein